MRFTLIILALVAFNVLPTFTPALHAAEENKVTERLDLDPAIQGLWKLHVTSNDEAKTLEQHDAVPFARVTGTKVKTTLAEDPMVVEKVVIFTPKGKDPTNLVRFTNGTIWWISKPKRGTNMVLIQVLNTDLEETFRFLVTVHE